MRKVVIIILLAAIMACPVYSFAASPDETRTAEKDETVYALLDHDGTVCGVYVVNSFETDGPGTVIDYGDYTEVKNLTSVLRPEYLGGAVLLKTQGGKLSYQGNSVKKEIPWDIRIKYFHDGKEKKADEIAGKSGSIQIVVDIRKNDKTEEGFFDNFTLQITAGFDADLFSKIEAPGATVVNAGKTKNISFTLLPGTSRSFTVKAETACFCLEPIRINGVLAEIPAELGALDKMLGGIADLTGGISEISKGARKLKSGSAGFNEGLKDIASAKNTLMDSSLRIKSSLVQFSDGLSRLVKESRDFKTLALQLSQSGDATVSALAGGWLMQLSALEEIAAGLEAIAGRYYEFDSGVGRLCRGLDTLKSNYARIDQGIGRLAGALEKMKGSADIVAGHNGDILKTITRRDSAYRPESFVSGKNRVNSVAFIMRTRAVEKPALSAKPETPPEKQGFWRKLFGLLYKG